MKKCLWNVCVLEYSWYRWGCKSLIPAVLSDVDIRYCISSGFSPFSWGTLSPTYFMLMLSWNILQFCRCLLFLSEIYSAISIPITSCPLLVTLHYAEQRTVLQSGVCQWQMAWWKQPQWRLVTWFMSCIEQAGYKCPCVTKCEVGQQIGRVCNKGQM